MRKFLLFILLVTLALQSCVRKLDVDVLIIGGGASGVAAGVQSARTGANTLIIEQTPWLGGMLTSAGVSCVDGNYNLRGGIFGEFADSLSARYGLFHYFNRESISSDTQQILSPTQNDLWIQVGIRL